jgi:hypothetical protein
VKKSIKGLLLELQKLCMSHAIRSLQLMKAPSMPSMQGGAFKYKEKTLEYFTLSDKLPSKYNRIFMHVGEGSIFIRVQSFF